MVGPSCSGFECVLFVIVVVAFIAVVATAAVLAGLVSAGMVRAITLRVGWEDCDPPVRVASFFGAVWLEVRAVRSMDDLPMASWIAIAGVSLTG